jgi:hypothetical protein
MPPVGLQWQAVLFSGDVSWHRNAMTKVEITLSVAGGVIALLLFALEVHGRKIDQRPRSQRVLIAVLAGTLIAVITAWVLYQHKPSPSSPRIDIATVRQLDVGVAADFVMQMFGAPEVRADIPKMALGFDDRLTYERYESAQYQVQVITNAERKVVAFAVRPKSAEPYYYSSSPINWILGQSTFEQLGPAENRYQGGDAKFSSYVERHYFGRWGHYNSFWFSSRVYGVTEDDVANYPRAGKTADWVAIANDSKRNMSDTERRAWESFILKFAGVHGQRFEEMVL